MVEPIGPPCSLYLQLQFTINNTASNRSEIITNQVTKFLAVYLDINLRWTEHIRYLVKKINSFRYALSILKSVCPMEVCLAVYYAYVYSVLSYGITVWGASTDSNRLFIAQKSIIRT